MSEIQRDIPPADHRPNTYPGGDDQIEMDEIELDDSPFCECGNELYEEEAAIGICSACGKELA